MREWLRQTRSFALGVLVVGALAACNSAHRGDNGTSETHFLRSCTESCADGYSCLCGVCTLACDDDAVCMAEGSRSAICGAPSADRNECGGVTRLCDMRCGGTAIVGPSAESSAARRAAAAGRRCRWTPAQLRVAALARVVAAAARAAGRPEPPGQSTEAPL